MPRFSRGWVELSALVGGALGLTLLWSAWQGGIQARRVSDNLFWIAAIYLLIAVFPVVAEMGGNMAAPWQALREGRALPEVLHEQRARYEPWRALPGRFGLAALLCMALGLGLGLR